MNDFRDTTLPAEVEVKWIKYDRLRIVALELGIDPEWFEKAGEGVSVSDEEILAAAENLSLRKKKERQGFCNLELYDGRRGRIIGGSSEDYRRVLKRVKGNGDILIMDTVPSPDQTDWMPRIWRRRGGEWEEMGLKPQYTFGTAKQWNDSVA